MNIELRDKIYNSIMNEKASKIKLKDIFCNVKKIYIEELGLENLFYHNRNDFIVLDSNIEEINRYKKSFMEKVSVLREECKSEPDDEVTNSIYRHIYFATFHQPFNREKILNKLKEGLNPNYYAASDHKSMLRLAIERKYEPFVDCFFQYGVIFDFEPEEINKIVDIAIEKNDDSLLLQLWESGVDLSALPIYSDYQEGEEKRNEFSYTYHLINILEINNYIKEHSETKFSIEERLLNILSDNMTQLYIEDIKHLIEEGVDINYHDEETGEFPLLICARKFFLEKDKYFKICKLLLENGANINDKDNKGTTVLMKSAYDLNLELLTYFIEQGVDVLAKDNEDKTALEHAIDQCQHGMKARPLLENATKKAIEATQTIDDIFNEAMLCFDTALDKLNMVAGVDSNKTYVK